MNSSDYWFAGYIAGYLREAPAEIMSANHSEYRRGYAAGSKRIDERDALDTHYVAPQREEGWKEQSKPVTM